MRAKADAKLQTYQALQAMLDEAEKGMQFAAASGPGAPTAAYAAPPAARLVAAGAGPSKEEVAKAKADADLFLWAASTLAAEGHPKAAAMRAEASQKASAYQALQAFLEESEKGMAYAAGAPASRSPPMAAPAVAAPAAAVPASMGLAAAPSKEEVDAAKAEADLYVWSANTLAAEGNPKAATMDATAKQKVQAYEALKAMFEAGQKKMAFA